jgi:hypothetical protein
MAAWEHSMPQTTRRRFLTGSLGVSMFTGLARSQQPVPGAGERHRVLVSTDIGGSDPDDFQSMVHLLVYSDLFDVEGLVSSSWGPGRARHILEVIDHYETDYPKLRTWSQRYPSPGRLRSITKQGETDFAVGAGYNRSTEGSDWIVECARRGDPRPLYVLVWGTIEDVAQALHDDPSIKKKLRVYFIGGPNKKWSPAAYNYIEENHPDLWIIENNSTYRGWFVGGNHSGDLGNRTFVQTHIRGRGALGDYFAGHLGGVIKMGDTPSVTYMMGTPANPSRPGWGGRFVRAWQRPKRVFDRLTKVDDKLETFGVLELVLPGPKGATGTLVVDGQEFPAAFEGPSSYRFRFVPKETKCWSYRTKSTAAQLDGLEGAFTSVDSLPDAASRPSARHPHWWTDDPDRAFAEGPHLGAVTVNRWREEFLRDFASRMLRCRDRRFG